MLNLQNDVDNTTRQYLKSIKNNKALTKAEEHTLLKRYRDNNDLDARNKIITSNLKFSCKLANQYRNRGLSFNDLISEANKGLIDSIDKFDLSQDVKFFSYAKWWIIQRIQTALEKNGEIKSYELTENVSNRLKSDTQDDEDEGEENATYNLLSSINEEAEGENKKRKKLVENILSRLTERECDIIKKYYGIGEEKLNLEEIGEKYSITKERVRQIMEATFRKMRSEALLNNN
jgi:RNA polymerase primary sigma factor